MVPSVVPDLAQLPQFWRNAAASFGPARHRARDRTTLDLPAQAPSADIVMVQGNDALATVRGLDHLRQVGLVVIAGNASLAAIPACPELATANAVLVGGSPALASIDGFGAFTSGVLSLVDLPGLTHLGGIGPGGPAFVFQAQGVALQDLHGPLAHVQLAVLDEEVELFVQRDAVAAFLGDPADLAAVSAVGRLAGALHGEALGFEELLELGELCGFAHPVEAFDGDEKTLLLVHGASMLP